MSDMANLWNTSVEISNSCGNTVRFIVVDIDLVQILQKLLSNVDDVHGKRNNLQSFRKYIVLYVYFCLFYLFIYQI